jgi:predicted NBD/HSP70 family sugar kinase
VTATGVIGALDIGGTHVSAGRVRLSSATVEAEARVRLEFTPGVTLLERILEAAKSVSTPETRGFGVAAPGPFDYDAGTCLVAHKLPGLYGINLRRELAPAVGLPGEAVSFLNDAEAFLLGEWWAGAARGHTRALGITLGTGLGSAFLEEGRFVRSGPRVPADGALYTLEFRGRPVEETISRSALLARYGADPDGGPDVGQIAERARAAETHARGVFQEVAADLAEFLAGSVEAFAPTCLVVGGSIARAWDLLEPTLEQGLAAYQPLVVARAVNIDDAPLLGAARHTAASEFGR